MTVVLMRDELQGVDDFSIAAFANQKFGCLAEANNGDTEDRHDEDEGTVGEPDIAPSGVGVPVADCRCIFAGKAV